jgi:hypothetical protein
MKDDLRKKLRGSLIIADADTPVLIAELQHRAKFESDKQAQKLFQPKESSSVPRV